MEYATDERPCADIHSDDILMRGKNRAGQHRGENRRALSSAWAWRIAATGSPLARFITSSP